ncbi:MAG: sialate O-acetylesterase [Halobacteriaceae archaeon]
MTDVFLVAGQSNANGLGDPDAAPPGPDGAREYDPEAGTLEPLSEPVGPGDGGSAWTAFARAYRDATGRPLVVVSTAVNGAALHPDADEHRDAGDWRPDGEYARHAVSAVEECMATLDDATFRGVLWQQGESDAIAIDDGHHSLDAYEAAFWDLLSYFRDAFGPETSLFLFQIGRRRDADTDGWRAVREAQAGFAAADENVHLVFDDAVAFGEDGRMQDVYHYTQAGYDEMGRVGGANVAEIVQRS